MSRHPKNIGEYIEGEVLQHLQCASHVPESESEWHDAIVTEDVSAEAVRDQAGVPVHSPSVDALDAGTVLEVKASQQRLASGQRGRFYIRKQQHDQLLDADAMYAFAVYNPREERIISLALTPTSVVDAALPGEWTNVSGRASTGYRQLTWTHFMPTSLVVDSPLSMPV